MDSRTPPTEKSEEIDIRIARIFGRDDGIVCVETKDDVHITIEDSKESYKAMEELAEGDKVRLLSLSGCGATMPNEVRDDWVAKKKDNPILAEARVAKSLAHKIIVNFVVNFYDVGRPMKMFTNEGKVVKWSKGWMNGEDNTC